MNRLSVFWSSSVGKKAVMAVTGLIGVLFVIGHMVGNLQVFLGALRINAYGRTLHGPLNELLWVVRVVLLVSVVLHVLAAYQLTVRDRAARPVGYARHEPQVSTLAARTMRWGGVLLLIFIVVHILHFTTGTIHPAGAILEGDVYANIVGSFQVPWVAAFYIVAMIALGLHLYHGAWSSMRSLGAAPASPHPLRRRLALVIALIVSIGFALVPVAVLTGVVRGGQ
jgi:succinate dehydrogenase / fumarate reductase, cytochrome b subunit